MIRTMFDDEIQGEEASGPSLARKRRKETKRPSSALSPKPKYGNSLS